MNQRREAQPTVLAMCLMQMSGINAGTADGGFYFLENDSQRLHIFRSKEGLLKISVDKVQVNIVR